MKAIQKILQTILLMGMIVMSFDGLSQSYQVVWADEFDGTGTGINGISGDWGYRIGGGQPNNEQEVYTNSNHFIQNGMLHIQARVESNGSITSTCLTTQGKKSWTYGKLEIRCSLPGFQGSWPSMFSLGESINTIGWPSCGEIDMFEQLNGSGTIYGTIHYNNNGHQQNQGTVNNPSIKSMHTYTVEWAPNLIKWYLDGVQYHSANTSGIDAYNHNFFILVNLAVGGDFPGQTVDRSALPADYIIDYVRVYQLSTCSVPAAPGNITGNSTVAPGSSQTYSVPAVSGATSYTWTLPAGWSGSSTTNTITTTAGSAGGTISVKANNSCGSSLVTSINVTINAGNNLALNKPTATSSTESATYPGSAAVDGNATTRWSSAFADPQWVSVDLGASYNVNDVKITWEAASAKNYLIQLSGDNVNWTTIKTVTGNTTLVNDNAGLAGAGRYVRMYGTARNTAYGYSIYEMEVYGTAVVTLPNLALNKPTATSSNETAAYLGSAAVDGNTTTRWSSAFADPQWISVDLGTSYNVNRVKITWEAASAKNYLIQTSTDNINWTTIKTVTGNATLINDNTGLVGTGRYVRMYGTARNTPYGYSIYELEVYGSSSGARLAVADETVGQVAVYPVPMKNTLTIKVPQNTYYEANVMNTITGNVEVHNRIEKEETEVNLSVDHLVKGSYILILKGNNGKLLKRKLLK